MAGGIFTNRPFELNIKCVVYAALLMIAYLVLPRKNNVFILPIIFIFAYVSMAWYDWMYNCQDKMYTGYTGIAGILDSAFKPQRRGEATVHERDHLLLENQEKIYESRVYLLHLLGVVPLLMYVGIKGKMADQRVYQPLFGAGLLAALYHGFRVWSPRKTDDNSKSRSTYLFHLVSVAPLLFYLGITKKNSHPAAFMAVLISSIIAALYHGSALMLQN